MYDVKVYGAVGDGSTADNAAIQNAINDAHSAGGGSVFFPPGNYRITASAIELKAGVKLLGEGYGSLITLDRSGALGINVTGTNASIQNLRIQGAANPAIGVAGSGFSVRQIWAVSSGTFPDCWLTW